MLPRPPIERSAKGKKACLSAAAARRWHRSRGPVARSSAAGSRERVRRAAPAAYTHTAEGRQMRAQICGITPPPRPQNTPTPPYAPPRAKTITHVGEGRNFNRGRPRAVPLVLGRLPDREVHGAES